MKPGPPIGSEAGDDPGEFLVPLLVLRRSVEGRALPSRFIDGDEKIGGLEQVGSRFQMAPGIYEVQFSWVRRFQNCGGEVALGHSDFRAHSSLWKIMQQALAFGGHIKHELLRLPPPV